MSGLRAEADADGADAADEGCGRGANSDGGDCGGGVVGGASDDR